MTKKERFKKVFPILKEKFENPNTLSVDGCGDSLGSMY